jgi:hypothetical protein
VDDGVVVASDSEKLGDSFRNRRGKGSSIPPAITRRTLPPISRNILKPSLPKPDSFDLDEPIVDVNETPPETTDEDEGEAELRSPSALVPRTPVEFKSTFPIDAPFGSYPRPNSLRTSKVSTVLGRTYPVDKQCCDSSTPCDEHDSYQAISPAGPNPYCKGQGKVSESPSTPAYLPSISLFTHIHNYS